MTKVIAYSSSKGTAKGFADRVNQGTGLPVVEIKDIPVSDLGKYEMIVFVTATYGRGNPPNDIKEWWEALDSSSTELPNLKYAVFACGSSNFKKTFCGFGKSLDAKLNSLKAKRIVEMGYNDDTEEDCSDFNAFVNALKQ